jgi:hypothetical protein
MTASSLAVDLGRSQTSNPRAQLCRRREAKLARSSGYAVAEDASRSLDPGCMQIIDNQSRLEEQARPDVERETGSTRLGPPGGPHGLI